MAATSLHISISAEKVLSLGGLTVSNSMIASAVVSALLIFFALAVRLSLKETNRPKGLQNVAEWIVESLVGLVQSVTGDTRKTALFFPYVASFFLFIMMNNWFGLLPGVGTIGFYEEEGPAHVAFQPVQIKTPVVVSQVHASTAAPSEGAETENVPVEDILEENVAADAAGEAAKTPERIFVPYLRAGTADLNTTLALGAMSMILVQIFGVMHLGLGYFKKFFNFSGPIEFFVGILEITSDFSKVISFAFRLFGNIFAGEVLLIVITGLTKVVAPMPFYGLEIFVGFIQALVFAMLSVVLYNMATLGHGDHH